MEYKDSGASLQNGEDLRSLTADVVPVDDIQDKTRASTSYEPNNGKTGKRRVPIPPLFFLAQNSWKS